MKKYLNFLFVVFISLALTSCFSYKELEIRNIESVKILCMNDSIADVEVVLRISNPNSSKIVVKNCDLNASINKKNVGKLKIDKKIIIPERSEKTYAVILKADVNQVKKLMPGLLFSNAALLNITGDMKVKMKWLSKNIKVDREEKISRKDLQNILMANE